MIVMSGLVSGVMTGAVADFLKIQRLRAAAMIIIIIERLRFIYPVRYF